MNHQVGRHSLTMTQAADYAQHRRLELQGRFLWGAGQAAHSLHGNSMFRRCQRWQLLHDFVQEKRRWTPHDEFLDVFIQPTPNYLLLQGTGGEFLSPMRS